MEKLLTLILLSMIVLAGCAEPPPATSQLQGTGTSPLTETITSTAQQLPPTIETPSPNPTIPIPYTSTPDIAAPLVAFAYGQGEERYICTIRADGSDLTCLSNYPNGVATMWSPDGSKLSFLVNFGVDGHDDLFIQDAESGKVKSKNFCGESYLEKLTWSSDSQRVAIACSEPNDAQNWSDSKVYLVNIEDMQSKALFDRGWHVYDVKWSPTGDEIAALVEEARFVLSIYILTPDGDIRKLPADIKLIQASLVARWAISIVSEEGRGSRRSLLFEYLLA